MAFTWNMYMNEFKATLGKDGRIALPASLRKILHFEPGEKLIIRIKDHEMCLTSLKHSVKKAQNLVRHYSKNQSLVKKLHDLRQEDKMHE
jgi:bifunctional DNA-binding transcriptional regulator/antitoxin component of YhaV-PrlF toxin-antitoxin module